MLIKDLSIDKHKVFKKKTKIENAALFYQIARRFSLFSLYNSTFEYIQRCFQMAVDTNCFPELDFSSVSKLLASSGLQVDSEVEIYNAANKWLNNNREERRNLAKQLLLKVRLNLLSDHCFKYLLSQSSCISTNNECIDVLNSRDIFHQNKLVIFNNSRYCNKTMFNITVCGGMNNSNKYKFSGYRHVRQFNVNNLKKFSTFPTFVTKRYDTKSTCLKGEIYVFGGYDIKPSGLFRLTSVEKYSPITKIWNTVTDMPDKRIDFCVCAFINKIYIFAGFEIKSGYLNSCFQFDTKKLNWKEMAKMNKARRFAACVVFDENIIVCGITDLLDDHKTVESYDVFSNTWKYMPSLIEIDRDHSMVSVKNKLFVFGRVYFNTYCEVFDKTSNKFVTLKSLDFIGSFGMKAVSVGNKILLLKHKTKHVLCYDVDKDEWLRESCEAIEDIGDYSLIKVPVY